MTLTPEERQRIYEEEKARLEAQERLKAEAKAREALSIPESKRAPRGGIGCLSIMGGVLALAIVFAVIGNLMTPSRTKTTSKPDSQDASARTMLTDKEEMLKNIGTVNTGLEDMNVGIAGETMEHIKLSLEVFNAAAALIQKAQSEQLTDEERAKVSELRKNLILRQRQALPIIRDKVGPIFSKELWITDAKARTFGDRFTTVEFVGASFAANANIANAQQAILAPLVRMRFKRAQYKWYSEQDEYSYYNIDSPSDGAVAIIDIQGNVTPVPE
jgi:hypothetical protein